MSELIEFIGKMLQQEMPIFFRIVIPISLTIYIFVYRERKETAYSTFKGKNEFSIYVYLVLIFILGILTLSGKIIEEPGVWYYSLLLTSFMIWIVTLFYVFIKLLNSINIFKIYQKQIRLVNIYQEILQILFYVTRKTYKPTFGKAIRLIISPLVRFYIKRISIAMEIKSQVLISNLNYNMPREFTKKLDMHLNQVANVIMFFANDNYEASASLNLTPDVEKTYDSLLEEVNLITIKSLEHYKYNEVEKVIYFYNSIAPMIQISSAFYYNFLNEKEDMYRNHKNNLDNLSSKYYLNIYSLVKILSLNKQNNNLKILRMLVRQSEDSLMYITSEEILSIFYSLTIDAVINNDVKLLTNTVNLAHEFNQNNPIRSETSSLDRGLTSIRILSIVKSIELGHHGCAGFLIKNIMRKTKGISLKYEFSMVRYVVNLHNGKIDPHSLSRFNQDSNVKILESLNFQLHYSNASLEYCFAKSAFLLYGQQKYLNKLDVLGIKYSDFINIEDYLSTYTKKYFVNKISELHKEYGLSYLKDIEFLNKL